MLVNGGSQQPPPLGIMYLYSTCLTCKETGAKTGSAKGGLKKVTNEVLSLHLQGAPERIFGSNHNSGSLHKDANVNE